MPPPSWHLPAALTVRSKEFAQGAGCYANQRTVWWRTNVAGVRGACEYACRESVTEGSLEHLVEGQRGAS
jgi:hypothetical protein